MLLVVVFDLVFRSLILIELNFLYNYLNRIGFRLSYWFQFLKLNFKSNLNYIRDTTPKRVMSGGAHLRCSALEQQSFEI